MIVKVVYIPHMAYIDMASGLTAAAGGNTGGEDMPVMEGSCVDAWEVGMEKAAGLTEGDDVVGTISPAAAAALRTMEGDDRAANDGSLPLIPPLSPSLSTLLSSRGRGGGL